MNEREYLKGRGSQQNPSSYFNKYSTVQDQWEGIDEPLLTAETPTKILTEFPKKIVNRVESPDVFGMYSMNPYQGCEHGCIYCYARNTHRYWGYSAGLDFERIVISKPEAPMLLRQQLMSKTWKPAPIALSGNTDCYQPAERKLKLTRKMLDVLIEFRHPVGIITKNALILRDLDLLKELASMNLVHVVVSLTSLNENLRRVMEPRTVSWQARLKTIEVLTNNGISTGVMTAPIIPGLNSMEIPSLIKAAADHGANTAGYTIVRLNGDLAAIFTDWIHKNFPDRAQKVLQQIKECHGGNLHDYRQGLRMRGEGNVADSIKQLFRVAVKKYMANRSAVELDCSLFTRPADKTGQRKLDLV